VFFFFFFVLVGGGGPKWGKVEKKRKKTSPNGAIPTLWATGIRIGAGERDLWASRVRNRKVITVLKPYRWLQKLDWDRLKTSDQEEVSQKGNSNTEGPWSDR